MVEILTLWGPYKLLKNFGALSEFAKCSQSSTKMKKIIEILSLYPGYDGMVKKPSHATGPLRLTRIRRLLYDIYTQIRLKYRKG
jgi:hypothetical protein